MFSVKYLRTGNMEFFNEKELLQKFPEVKQHFTSMKCCIRIIVKSNTYGNVVIRRMNNGQV